MRVAVIGGSGHIGTYLTPRLVRAGHEVTCVSRQLRQPYIGDAAWRQVEHVAVERGSDDFAPKVASLHSDIVIDLISYTLESTMELVEALSDRVELLLHCGTVWIHGHAVEVPTTEEQARNPISNYGRKKAAIESYLLNQTKIPASVLHPGHLVGIGWTPLNPTANFRREVFDAIASGGEVAMPNFGRETLHHVHADDVAQSFEKAIEHRARAIGQAFHICSPAAITMTGYADTVASWHGREANLRFLPWDEWRTQVPEEDARITWDHIARSPSYSIEKARRLIDYQPQYSSLEAIRESLFHESV